MTEEDNPRARLTRELTREKERALQEQKEKYEEKISRMKERNKSRRTFSKSLRREKKRKILSPRELQKEKIKGKKEVREYREEKYRTSRTGKVGRAIEEIQAQRIRALKYGRSYRPMPQPRSSFRRPMPRPRGARIIAPTYQQKLAYLEATQPWWADALVTPQVEREISGSGMNSLNKEGDVAANIVGREAKLFGNFLTDAPVKAIEVESLINAKAVDISPSLMLDAEVNAFANILNPQSRQRKRRRRR